MDGLFQSAELKVPLYQEFLPLVLGYVENSADIFGLNKDEIPSLVLATEEIFSFLMFNAKSAETIVLTCRFRGSYIEVIAKFTSEMLPVESLNLTSKVVTNDISALDSMGLMIAARSVDNLRLDTDDAGNMLLHMIKKKQYKRLEAKPTPAISYSRILNAIDVEVERLTEFCALALAKYKGTPAAGLVRYPDQLVDMIARGNLDGCFAEDEQGHIAGALFWQSNGHILLGYGMYVFAPDPAVIGSLTQGCIDRTVRVNPFMMFIKDATPETRAKFLTVKDSIYFPMKPSDRNESVYLSSALVPYVKDYYHYIGVQRNIYEQMTTSTDIGLLSPHSAFAAEVDKEESEATLSVLWIGKDATANLKNHIEVLGKEGFKKINFELEISKQNQAVMGDFLLEAGFKPDIIIPWTDEGDILNFVYHP